MENRYYPNLLAGTMDVNTGATLKIHPNPALNQISVELSENLIGTPYWILDALGTTILSGKLQAPVEIIPLNTLTAGLFTLKTLEWSVKIVKIH